MCRTAAEIVASDVDILGGSLKDAASVSSVESSAVPCMSQPTIKRVVPTGSVSFPMGRACTSPIPSFRKSGSVAGLPREDSMGASQTLPAVRRVRVKTAGGKATILVRARTAHFVRSADGSMTFERSNSSEFSESHVPPNSRVVLFREISQEELMASGRFKKRSASDISKEHEKSTDCSEAGSDESTEGGVHTELCRVDSGSTEASEEKKSIVRSALLDFVTSRPSLESLFPRFNLFNFFKKEEPKALVEDKQEEEQQLALSRSISPIVLDGEDEGEAALALSSGSIEAVFFEYAIVPDDDDDDEEGALILEDGSHLENEAITPVNKVQTIEQGSFWEACHKTFSKLFKPSFSKSESMPLPKTTTEPIFVVLAAEAEEGSTKTETSSATLALTDSEPSALEQEEEKVDEEEEEEEEEEEQAAPTKSRMDSPWVLASGAVVASLVATAAAVVLVRSRSGRSSA